MTEKAKEIIEKVDKYYITVPKNPWVYLSDFTRIVKQLCEENDQKVRQKLEWERKYWEAYDLLEKNGIVKPAIRIDVSKTA